MLFKTHILEGIERGEVTTAFPSGAANYFGLTAR
jgi:hypothetical protein